VCLQFCVVDDPVAVCPQPLHEGFEAGHDKSWVGLLRWGEGILNTERE
jgi:hypothetical protein